MKCIVPHCRATLRDKSDMRRHDEVVHGVCQFHHHRCAGKCGQLFECRNTSCVNLNGTKQRPLCSKCFQEACERKPEAHLLAYRARIPNHGKGELS